MPKKSNWSNPIDQPPYWAFSITGGVTFTFGGLQINESAQVLNTSGNPIRGLYASGDIIGLFFPQLPVVYGSDTQCRLLTLGRTARRGSGVIGHLDFKIEQQFNNQRKDRQVLGG